MMRKPQRWTPIVAGTSIVFLLILLYKSNLSRETFHNLPGPLKKLPQFMGLGEYTQDLNKTEIMFKPNFTHGVVKPPGEGYTRKLIITKTKAEDIGWMEEHIADVDKDVYVADDPEAPLHPPENKGHEVMIWLTYIIDNYENLPEIMMFMHAHQFTWHNNDILNHDAAEMVRRLSSERVIREGFMNMRCHWMPGCPNWMHPGELDVDSHRPEEVMLAKSWAELFPFEPAPDVLGAACCSQLALSRERVRSIPLEKYKFYRDWLFKTEMPDFMSGRVWEYMWQYVFTGQTVHCPVEHVCYCDGYGVCFGGQQQYEEWFGVRGEKDWRQRDLDEWENKQKKIEEAYEQHWPLEEIEKLEKPEPGLNDTLKAEIKVFEDEMLRRTNEAIGRGNDPRNRAFEAGREWHDGDGF